MIDLNQKSMGWSWIDFTGCALY